MISGLAAVPSDERLPEAVDTVVIGGGIAGVSTALFLARKGVSVALCEKGLIGAEQSSRNWGWCRQMGRDPREIPLIVESLDLWRRMDEMTGEETGFRQTGILYLCEDRKALDERAKWMEHARAYQLDSRLITGEEVAELMPGTAKAWAGALYTPSDGRAEPFKAAPAIALGARKAGAHIATGCAVRGIETSGGRVSAVVTEKGRIACSSAVLAGGAWSRVFCRNLGITLPQLKLLSSVMRTTPVENGPAPSAWGPGFSFRKRDDGGYTVAHGGVTVAEIVPDSFRFLLAFIPQIRDERRSLRLRLNRRFLEEWRMKTRWSLDEATPFEAVRILDPSPQKHILDEAFANLKRAFPAFETARVAESWAGLIDATPDTVPVISSLDTLPGFHIATGFSGHGFGLGPGAGRLMADLVTGDEPIVDPAPFSLKRFGGTA
ncbi:FAD-binding oxidoreductase [Kaustia mangrovi]|uniref:FAD-binding oxidoreductase n=1 Tax=Kaustia mangrovi TaxID=2593653 RepID=A0A7S8C3B2_9HYPH|nr:FAD-binding oxidoreductase [Kaustia mangrovi]QPC42591.1 FAD-binding oxidoreductase [Kaustia mangrovi]